MDAKTIAKHFGLPRADDDYPQEPSADYMRGFKAGREAGLREAAQIIMRKDNGGLTDQDAILSAIGGGK